MLDSASRPLVDVRHVAPTITVGAFSNVHLCVYRGELTLEAIEMANMHHRRLMERHPLTFVLGVAHTTLPLPSADVRQLGARLIEENRGRVEAAAVVVEGAGFWASTVRSVVTASFALARQPYPSKCFAEGVDAGTWFATFPAGRGLAPNEVASALAQLRAAT